MQNWPLTVDRIIDHARNWHGGTEVVSRSVEGPIVRSTYAEVHARARRITHFLRALGAVPGDRIATLAWNTTRHLELWYAIMGMGAICHTLNPRLFAQQLVHIINEARDRFIFVDRDLLLLLAPIREHIACVERVIVLADEADMPADFPAALCFESLLAGADSDGDWGGFDEDTAAGLCFTSGTVGNPKGVLYSHRSNFLHTLITVSPDVFGLSALDTVLPIVPLFHANAWGLAFSAPAVGAKLVLPGNRLDGPSVHDLLEREGVTFSAAVPTVWQSLLQHLRATNGRLTTLKRVVIGGSAVPEFLLRAFRDDYAVDVVHAWGMTEMSPLGTVATASRTTAAASDEDRLRLTLKQGRPPLGVEMKLTDEQGHLLPHDGATPGGLKVRGPCVARAYLNSDRSALDDSGFFDTGDVATIDTHGFLHIVDRTKDAIKSGGEWISSIAIENIAVSHPKVALAAAIGVAHAVWGERPLLLIRLKDGQSADEAEILQFFCGKTAKWCIPDRVAFVAEIPLGPTGKIDKKALRQRLHAAADGGADT